MELTGFTSEQLQAELNKRQSIEEKPDFQPRLAETYTVGEKVAAFDRLHEMALFHWNQTKADQYANEDFDHYVAEAVLVLLAHSGDDTRRFWNEWRKLTP